MKIFACGLSSVIVCPSSILVEKTKLGGLTDKEGRVAVCNLVGDQSMPFPWKLQWIE